MLSLRIPTNFVGIYLVFVTVTVKLSEQKPLITLGDGIQAYPFVDYISINPDNVIFYLYPFPKLEAQQNEFDILIHGDIASIENSRYNADLPVIILIHGFTQDLLTSFPREVLDAYLKSGEVARANVIVVDWGQLSGPRIPEINNADYHFVTDRSMPIVGQRVGDFLMFLTNTKKLRGPDAIHVVGQSLGSQIAGGVGAYYKNITGNLIGRITGLDPAGPGFQDKPDFMRLDHTDAAFVDIVHTDAGGYGYNGATGHADFYVNGGKAIQPGCEHADSFCSHNRAPTFYSLSILNRELMACADPDKIMECPEGKKVHFGESCPPSRGQFYLTYIL